MEESLFPSSPIPKDEGSEPPAWQPLAERIRPNCLEEVVGQTHLVGEGRFLSQTIRADQVPSMILWGPPGTGKTTLARIIARETRSHFVAMSAVLAGVKDVKRIIEEAHYQRRAKSRQTILFVDEIHRFNKAQQDAFLPHVENGTLTLIGATTENPSFEVIAPLLSRTRVLVLNPLSDDEIELIVRRTLKDTSRGLGLSGVEIDKKALEQLVLHANGDARKALTSLELAWQLTEQGSRSEKTISGTVVEQAIQQKSPTYDKGGEEHYNLISALHKSIRNSDVDASLYWLARMLEAGEDPLYIARRLVRIASEDVGLADPQALGVALDGMQAFHFIGSPEGELALAQVTVYLAQTAKSNALYIAYGSAAKDVKNTRQEPVPMHLRNAPTRLMKNLGYSKGYRYAHNEKEGTTAMDCLPENLRGRRYYRPTHRGAERAIRDRLNEWQKLRNQQRKSQE
jgi:putative ATPase